MELFVHPFDIPLLVERFLFECVNFVPIKMRPSISNKHHLGTRWVSDLGAIIITFLSLNNLPHNNRCSTNF